MSGGIRHLLTLEGISPKQHALLRLLEPPGSCPDSLWARLFGGTYDKPFIIDRGTRRFLHFDLAAVQSVMHLEHPDRLSLAYTRKMMAFLLFNRTPGRILLLGLGGGSLAKFCYRHLPDAAITAVEVSSDVIALREAFRIPPDDERFRVIRADAAAYVARLGQFQDVILADACNSVGIAPELDTIDFYQDIYSRLSRGGMFVTNLCGDGHWGARHVVKIRHVFGEEFMRLQVREDGNVILLAFKEPRPEVDWQRLAAAAPELKRRFGLDFPRYVRRIAHNWNSRGGGQVFI